MYYNRQPQKQFPSQAYNTLQQREANGNIRQGGMDRLAAMRAQQGQPQMQPYPERPMGPYNGNAWGQSQRYQGPEGMGNGGMMHNLIGRLTPDQSQQMRDRWGAAQGIGQQMGQAMGAYPNQGQRPPGYRDPRMGQMQQAVQNQPQQMQPMPMQRPRPAVPTQPVGLLSAPPKPSGYNATTGAANIRRNAHDYD